MDKHRRHSAFTDLLVHGLSKSALQHLTPLRMLQASPFLHWLEHDEDFRNLARFFTIHHFTAGDMLPDSPFYLIAGGMVKVLTDGGTHESVEHARGSFIVAVSAPFNVSKRSSSRGILSWLCGPRDDWDDYVDSDSDSDNDEDGSFARGNGQGALYNANSSPSFNNNNNNSFAKNASTTNGNPSNARGTYAIARQGNTGGGAQPGAAAPGAAPERTGTRASCSSGAVGGSPAANNNTRLNTRVGSLAVGMRKANTRVRATMEGAALIVTDLSKVQKLMRTSQLMSNAIREVCALESLLMQVPLLRGPFLTPASRLLLRDLVSYRAVDMGQVRRRRRRPLATSLSPPPSRAVIAHLKTSAEVACEWRAARPLPDLPPRDSTHTCVDTCA